MRRASGPIVTTGVAMAAAAVVVANPIITPRADVQIPAVALSSGGDMLDKAFLDAIAPTPPESTNPLSVLKQLVSALAADATYIGKNAIVDAFVAGVTAVTPNLPSGPGTVTPPPVVLPPAPPVVLPPPPDLTSLVPAMTPRVDASVLSSTISSVPVEITTAASTFINRSVVPAVEQVVSALYHDATYLAKNVLTAAFAVGAAVAAEPGLIGDTLKALINGDIGGALQNAVKAVVKVVETPITSSMLIITAIKDIIEGHLEDLTGIFIPVPSADVPPAATTPRAGAGAPLVPAPTGRRPQSGDAALLSTSRTASALAAVSPRAAAALPAFDASVPAPRQAVGAVRDAVRSAGEQIGAAVQNPVGKASARARGAAAR